jgi:pSer/pThr/pTyr-binding forkhead associated (FHA) protein
VRLGRSSHLTEHIWHSESIMKLSLVVASGVHAGKAIPVTVPQFAIGRDPQCQLRPASPSISKRHCALFVKGKQVLIRDFGSTNGTFVNGTLVEGEVPLKDGDEIKVGPLDFKVSIAMTAATPKPAAAPAAAAATLGDPPADGETVEIKPETSDEDKLAALLLDDDGAPNSTLGPDDIPQGSTVMEVPAQAVAATESTKPGAPPARKPVVGTGNTSDAAAEILKRYQRRPRS